MFLIFKMLRLAENRLNQMFTCVYNIINNIENIQSCREIVFSNYNNKPKHQTCLRFYRFFAIFTYFCLTF